MSCAEDIGKPDGSSAESHTGPKEIAGFRILCEIGSGGMGTVYKAIDRKMNRTVALKVLSRHLSTSEINQARFAREVWIGGKLNHPNLVRVYERGEWEDVNFFSMELIDGGSLHDVIREMKRWGRDERWNLQFGSREYITWVISQVIQAAQGLDYAHRQGVIHRDIKPMNILLEKNPFTVKVADFGLAVDIDAELTRLTTAGRLMGTVAYMAPEQIRGDLTAIDARTDVYSLAVSLFELLTLELPYVGSTQPMYMNAVLTSEPRRPSRLNERVGRDLEIVLSKALEKSPRDRYHSASAFAADLENVLALKPIVAKPPTPAARLAKWARRRPYRAVLVGLLAVSVPLGGALTFQNVRSQRRIAQVELNLLWERAHERGLQGKYGEAAELYSEILEMHPQHIGALRRRAVCYYRLAIDKGSSLELPAYMTHALTDISTVVARLPQESWPYRTRAYFYRKFGRENEAAQDEMRARSFQSSEPSDQEIEIKAILAFSDKAYEEAAQFYTELLDRHPGNRDAILGRAQAYGLLGRVDDALVEYRVAAGLNPENAYPHRAMGQFLTGSGRLEEGHRAYQTAIQLAPNSALAYADLSANLVQQAILRASKADETAALTHLEKAERAARRSIELDPRIPEAHLNLGVALMERFRLLHHPAPAIVDEAIAEYEEAGALTEPLSETYESALQNRCDALIQSQRLKAALQACTEIADLDPTNPVNFYNLAGIYALLGRADEAFAALEKDLALGDTDHDYLAGDDWFASLRGDERFTSILERMKTSDPNP